MSKNQENSEDNTEQPVIEDLTVNKDEEDVKGGGWGSSMYQYSFDTTYHY